ncbi:MAG TPA: hypothetical protein VJK09_01860 [Candidatus Paceibacterota bacterium]
MGLLNSLKSIFEGIDSLDAALNLKDRAMGKKDAPAEGTKPSSSKTADEAARAFEDRLWKRIVGVILTNPRRAGNTYTILTMSAPANASDEEKEKIKKRKEGLKRLLLASAMGLIKPTREGRGDKRKKKEAKLAADRGYL